MKPWAGGVSTDDTGTLFIFCEMKKPHKGWGPRVLIKKSQEVDGRSKPAASKNKDPLLNFANLEQTGSLTKKEEDQLYLKDYEAHKRHDDCGKH